jgi:esterase/lipase superfamily enzyme
MLWKDIIDSDHDNHIRLFRSPPLKYMYSFYQRPLIMHRLSDHFLSGIKLAAICLFLAACSSDDDELETDRQPDEAVEKASSNVIRGTVPFITLRNKTGNIAAAEHFGDERNSVHTGYCDVSWTPIPMLEPVANNVPFYIPHGKIQLEAIYEVSEKDFWRAPRSVAVNDHPLLYIHGYNIGFEKGCSRAAIFQEKLHLAGRFLLFSWPSNDTVLNYTHDEADIYWSIADIERTLERMIRSFGAGSLDVVAHSMGTRGAFLALVRMSDQYNGETPLLNRLVLLAADIDAGIFSQYLDVIRPLVRNITIYVSDNDNALALSEEVHGYPRLGVTGAHLRNLDGIEIIDVSAIGRRRASGHLYHLYNNSVINDLDQLLNENRSAPDRSGLQQDLQLGGNYWKLLPPDVN